MVMMVSMVIDRKDKKEYDRIENGIFAYAYKGVAMGTDGQNGGLGGDAGACGYGGRRGEAGNISLFSLDENSDNLGRESKAA